MFYSAYLLHFQPHPIVAYNKRAAVDNEKNDDDDYDATRRDARRFKCFLCAFTRR